MSGKCAAHDPSVAEYRDTSPEDWGGKGESHGGEEA